MAPKAGSRKGVQADAVTKLLGSRLLVSIRLKKGGWNFVLDLNEKRREEKELEENSAIPS